MDQTQASRWRCSRALLRALPFVVAALFAHPPAARAQGRPDIVWMRGTVGDFWQGMSMSADRRALAMVCDFGERAKVWRTSDGMLQCTATVSGTQNSGVALSHDGETLVGAGYDGVLRLWRVADGELIRTIAGPTGQSLWPACSPVTDTVAAVFADDTIKLHRMSDGALVGAIALPDFVWRLAFAPDGSMLAAACADKTVWVWRVSDGALVRRLAGHTGKVTCVCFSSDGSTLASGSDDGTIRRWRVADGSQIGFIGGLGGVASVDLPPLGSLMAAVCKGYLKVWDLVDGSLKCSTVGGATPVLPSQQTVCQSSAAFTTRTASANGAPPTVRLRRCWPAPLSVAQPSRRTRPWWPP